MTIRNPVLFGLKVAFNFSDAESKIKCLSNLGLDIRDLDIIRGISGNVDKLDLQNVSGLDVNLTRYLDRLKSDTGLYSGIVNILGGYQYTLQGNLEAFGPLSGGAVRYKYIPNDAGTGLTKNNLKFGDISTSRVSAWSADGEDNDVPISYGASVQVRGVVKLGQKGGFAPGTTEALINVLDDPEPIRFATEVATEVLEIELNGNTRYIYAMRGIPIIFTTAFKSLSMDFTVTTRPEGNPVYTIQATDKSEPEIQSTPPVAGNVSRLRYNAPNYKERFIKLYYPPKSVEAITATSLNIRYLPAVKFFELRNIQVQGNLLGEMPDWRDITYSYDRVSPTNSPTSKLTYINVSNNPLSVTDNEELRQYGTNVLERLPKTLVDYYASGTYSANTEYKSIDESCVIVCKDVEYNLVAVDPESTQNYDFGQVLAVGSIEFTTNVKGIFYDKQVHPSTGEYYVYVKDPVLTKDSNWLPTSGIDKIETNADWLTLINGGIFPNYATYYLPLNMATRCPALQTYYMRNSGGRRIYKNSNTRGPLETGTTKYVQYQTSQEITPTVNLETIRTYDVYDNSYTKLSDIFRSPQSYVPATGVSTLRTFNVGENESLSEIADALDFGRMEQINSINIYDTALPIPQNLAGNTSLSSLTCSYTRFPSRPGVPQPGTPYTKEFKDNTGAVTGYVNPVTGDGNPSGSTNHLFKNKFPVSETEYGLADCANLSKLSFYSSRLDGMIPKFVGNDKLSSIDFRYTNIEGGRPPDPSSGLHGRRYVMWDDTFEDAQNIVSIRIRSGNLGRNIGIFTPDAVTGGSYAEASFEGATFNLPLLETLDIVSTNQLLRGTFFNTGGAPNLKILRSPSSGWGLDLPNGAPFPAFTSNTKLEEIDLSGNNFSGQLTLSGANKLKKFYANNNAIESIDVGNFTGLNSLQYFILSNNQISGQIPNFSSNAPNIQYISLNNNDYGSTSGGISPFTPGLLSQCSKLKSLDLQSNGFNSGTIDDILLEMLANYNIAPRSGVVVNLGGNNAPPTAGENTIPTTTTSTQTEIVTVGEQVPGSEQFIFFNPQDFTIGIKTGQDPNDGNLSYVTQIKQNGTDITNLLSIDYNNETITFPSVPPATGDVLEINVTTITQGFITEETGGIVTLKQLRNLNWIVTCNNPPN